MTDRAALLDLPGEITGQLTERQVAIYGFIVDFLAMAGYPPSVREIKSHIGVKSTSTVHLDLNQIQALGLVRREPGHSRALTVVELDAPTDEVTETTEEAA